MIKFLHAADLHLDSPFHSLPPEKAAQRRQEQRQLLDELVSLCNREACSLLLLSGDLFDAQAARRDSVDALRRSLAACRARVFIAPGNHDFCTPGSPYLQADWPENVHIFRDSAPQPVLLEDLGVEVWGAAFTAPTAPPLLEGFRLPPRRAAAALMVLHGDPETPSSPYNAISPGQIEASGLDYLALGHLHTAGGLRKAGQTHYAWPGCPMGRGFDETGQKGVYLGALSPSGCSLEFCPLPGRRYELLTVEAGGDPLAAVEAALPADTAADIYRILLTGRCDPPDVPGLLDALAGRFFSLDIRDRTEPLQDLWAARTEDSLKGLFLQALYEDPRRQEDPALIELAAALGTAILEGREVPEA